MKTSHTAEEIVKTPKEVESGGKLMGAWKVFFPRRKRLIEYGGDRPIN